MLSLVLYKGTVVLHEGTSSYHRRQKVLYIYKQLYVKSKKNSAMIAFFIVRMKHHLPQGFLIRFDLNRVERIRNHDETPKKAFLLFLFTSNSESFNQLSMYKSE